MKTIIALITLTFLTNAFSQTLGSNTIHNKKTGETIEVKCSDEKCAEIVFYKNIINTSQEIKRIETLKLAEIFQKTFDKQRDDLRQAYLNTFYGHDYDGGTGWGEAMWGEGFCIAGILFPLGWPVGAVCLGVAAVDIAVVTPIKGIVEVIDVTNLKRTRKELIKLMRSTDSHVILRNKQFKRIERVIEQF